MKNTLCKITLGCIVFVFQFTLHAQTPPVITVQPTPQTSSCPATVTFSVTATGTPPLLYQWAADGLTLYNETNSSLVLSNVFAGSGTRFSVIVSNSLGAVASEPAILTITNSPTPALSITNIGSGTNRISWPHTCEPFILQSTTLLTNWTPFPSVLYVDDFTNHVEIGTNNAPLAFELARVMPIITTNPVSQSKAIGSNVTFSVGAINPVWTNNPVWNTNIFFYQWRLNGIFLTNQTNASLVLTDVQRRDAGSYDVVVANSMNAVASKIASLEVGNSPFKLADRFDDRASTNSFSGAINANNVGATKELFEPNHAGILGGKSVWLAWQAPTNGIATFDTQGSGIDTVLAVYTGTSVSTLSLVTSDDDSGGFYTSRVQFNAVAGTVYQIVIDGLAGDSGNIALNWTLEETADKIPVIVQQPRRQTVLGGPGTNSFTVVVTNTDAFPPLKYQWKFNGINITNATNSVLTLVNANTNDVGPYSVTISNSVRSVESLVANLDLEQMTTNAVLAELLQVRDKLDVWLNPPATNKTLMSASQSGSPLKPQSVSVSAGTITLNTTYGLTQGWDPTVCGIAVYGTLYVDVYPTKDGTLTLSTTPSASPSVDTVLKVRLPNLAAPWTDDISAFDKRSAIVITGVKANYRYPVTIGNKSGSPASSIALSVTLQ